MGLAMIENIPKLIVFVNLGSTCSRSFNSLGPMNVVVSNFLTDPFSWEYFSAPIAMLFSKSTLAEKVGAIAELSMIADVK